MFLLFNFKKATALMEELQVCFSLHFNHVVTDVSERVPGIRPNDKLYAWVVRGEDSADVESEGVVAHVEDVRGDRGNCFCCGAALVGFLSSLLLMCAAVHVCIPSSICWCHMVMANRIPCSCISTTSSIAPIT